MTRNTALALGIALTLLMLYFFYSGGFAIPGASDTVSPDTSDSQETSTFTGTMADLLRRGGAWRCTFVQADGDTVTRGTVFVDNARVRGDFESDLQGITLESHLLVKGDFLYAWSPVSPGGVKAPFTPGAAGSEGAPEAAREVYTHECRAWVPDEGTFTLPNVDFIDTGVF